ncbi:MAG: hypothetical protein Q9186_005472 [Xanthomendoza sp. 1 TL-2023]
MTTTPTTPTKLVPTPTLTFDWTPPKQDSSTAGLTPLQFLHKLPMNQVKSKTTLARLSKGALNHLRLDPAPIDSDSTILIYHKRLTDPSSPYASARQNLKIALPAANFLERYQMSDNLVDASRADTELSQKLEELRLQFADMSKKSNARFAAIDSHFTNIEDQQIVHHHQFVQYRNYRDEQDLKLHRFNFFEVYVTVLCARLNLSLSTLPNNGSDPAHCSERLANAHVLFIRMAKAEKWKAKTGLNHKYYHHLKEAVSLNTERNNVAHQTSSSFAKLLTDPVFMAGPHGQWTAWYEELFQYCYHWENGDPMTLRDCATFDEAELTKRKVMKADVHPDPGSKAHKQKAHSALRILLLGSTPQPYATPLNSVILGIPDNATAGYPLPQAIWFYDSPKDPECFSTNALIESFQRVLAAYPAFAGRLEHIPYRPDGNWSERFGRLRVTYGTGEDPGVETVIAYCETKLGEVVPSAKDRGRVWNASDLPFHLFLGSDLKKALHDGLETGGLPAAAVKVTTFACGGIAIAAKLQHVLGDAQNFLRFVHDWAATHRNMIKGLPLPISDPIFDPQKLDQMAAGDINAAKPDEDITTTP